jgi:PAS domain S-box-containing protein
VTANFYLQIQNIRQQIEVLQQQICSTPTQEKLERLIEQIYACVSTLQLLDEERLASLELMQVIQEELLEQNTLLSVERQDYYDLFQYAPDVYLVTNPQGIILKANEAAASKFNVLQNFLVDKPLINFISQAERSIFRSKLNHLPQMNFVEEWGITMCPRGGKLFDASLLVAPVRQLSGEVVALRINIRDITKHKQANLELDTHQQITSTAEVSMQLNGLRVLFVDDETDAREFITAVLEQYGVLVTAVASVAEALQVLEQLRPDVLLSDIRMPDEDGYALIKKVRAIEAEKGWQIPTGALTAYLPEDRAKAIKAGFQSHLYKLAEPTKLVEMVAQLAGRV